MAIQRRDLFRAGAMAMLAACQGGSDSGLRSSVSGQNNDGSDGSSGSNGSGLGPKTGARRPETSSWPGSSIAELSIAELNSQLAAGSLTSVQLVATYRARTDAINTRGPALRAVIELDPDAEENAEARDRERASGKVRGPLHGIPILVKDNVDTAGKMKTSAGSLALAATPAEHDAFAIGKLRAAGAIVLGKANLSEWANYRGNAPSSGWSARGGQCRNPYALDRTPSGSSSGSAAAAAAGLCAAAIGSETDGSIVSPSGFHGLVGVKPTIGVVSRTGVIPISTSQDTLGPIARCVADAALVLAAIAGEDPDDPTTLGVGRGAPQDFTRVRDPHALTGARLGVPRKIMYGGCRAVDAVIATALEKLASLGAEIVELPDLEQPPELAAAEQIVMATELAPAMAAYLARRPGVAPKSLADLIAFNAAHADVELVHFGQELFEQAAARPGLKDPAYLAAKKLCRTIARDHLIDKPFADHRLDAYVAPTGALPWLIDLLMGDGNEFGCSAIPAIAGCPHVTVCGGAVLGLPVGLSFIGKAFTDAKLLAYAYAFEQATHHRQPPTYRATVEIPG